MSSKHNSLIPENNRVSYTEYDIIDFVADYNGQRVVPNTFRISGELEVYKNNVPIVNTDKIQLDSMCGVHNLFQQISTEFSNIGLIESVNNYGRSTKMMNSAQYQNVDMLNGTHSTEMKSPLDTMAAVLIKSQNVKDLLPESQYTAKASFSMKPVIALNRVFSQTGGDTTMTYSKFGSIKVSLQLNRVVNFLYGQDMDSTISYKLFNPRLEFLSVPDDKSAQAPLVMKIKNSLKTTLNSSLSTVSVKAPMVADSISMSFIKQSDDNQNLVNSLKQEQLKDVSELVISYNNQLNQLTTYTLRDTTEMLNLYVKSLGSREVSNLSLTRLKGNDGFGLGYSFGETPVDLSKNLVQFQITSDIDSSAPISAYVLIQGFLQV